MMNTDQYVCHVCQEHLYDTSTYKYLTPTKAKHQTELLKFKLAKFYKDHNDVFTDGEQNYLLSHLKENTDPYANFFINLKIHKIHGKHTQSAPLVGDSYTHLAYLSYTRNNLTRKVWQMLGLIRTNLSFLLLSVRHAIWMASMLSLGGCSMGMVVRVGRLWTSWSMLSLGATPPTKSIKIEKLFSSIVHNFRIQSENDQHFSHKNTHTRAHTKDREILNNPDPLTIRQIHI